MPKVKLTLSIGFHGGVRKGIVEIDDVLWDSATEEEREKILDETARDWADSYIELNTEVVPA